MRCRTCEASQGRPSWHRSLISAVHARNETFLQRSTPSRRPSRAMGMGSYLRGPFLREGNELCDVMSERSLDIGTKPLKPYEPKTLTPKSLNLNRLVRMKAGLGFECRWHRQPSLVHGSLKAKVTACLGSLV